MRANRGHSPLPLHTRLLSRSLVLSPRSARAGNEHLFSLLHLPSPKEPLPDLPVLVAPLERGRRPPPPAWCRKNKPLGGDVRLLAFYRQYDIISSSHVCRPPSAVRRPPSPSLVPLLVGAAINNCNRRVETSHRTCQRPRGHTDTRTRPDSLHIESVRLWFPLLHCIDIDIHTFIHSYTHSYTHSSTRPLSLPAHQRWQQDPRSLDCLRCARCAALRMGAL